jgi:hypothetical protein
MTKTKDDRQNKESDNGHPNNDEDSAHISVDVNPQEEYWWAMLPLFWLSPGMRNRDSEWSSFEV